MNQVQVITLSNGLKFKIATDSQSGDEQHIKNNLVSGEEYTPRGFEISQTDTVIDIGAHSGRFAIYAADKAKNGRIFAFEPQPENLTRLKENIELNNFKNIVVSANAIADSTKHLLLHTNVDSARSSIYGTSRETVEIECIPLAEVFEKNKMQECNFLKLDCEGAEYEILFALPSSYFSKIGKIVLEYHDHLSPQKKLPDMVRLLSRYGFLISIRPGAFYTGLLFAQKTKLTGMVLLALNKMRIYFDMGIFLLKLTFKRLWGLMKS